MLTPPPPLPPPHVKEARWIWLVTFWIPFVKICPIKASVPKQNLLFPLRCFKTALLHNLSHGIEFFLHVYCLENQTNFHMKGCVPRLVLKQRKKTTWKWLIKVVRLYFFRSTSTQLWMFNALLPYVGRSSCFAHLLEIE